MKKKMSFFLVYIIVFQLTGSHFVSALGANEASQPSAYSYVNMAEDITRLVERYPQWVRKDCIGQTIDGRNIYHLVIGSPNASDHVLVFASIHAREYITAQLVMKQTEAFLEELTSGQGYYNGKTYQQLLENTAIHVVPMLNPDGVALSQFGLEGIKKSSTRQGIYRIYEMDGAVELEPYLRKWKSNAEGVDINRNFDALWEQYDDHLGHPSADHFKGNAIGDTMEAHSLILLTEKYQFRRTISYHAQGEVIYWYFSRKNELLKESKEFAEAISNVTGYPLDGNYEQLDPAGYKDWAIMKKAIPSLTIEVGRGEVPLDVQQLQGIYERNRDVWAATLDTLIKNR